MLVFPSLYCVYYSSIFVVIYYNLYCYPLHWLCFRPMCCIIIVIIWNHGCGWVWFCNFCWCRCWGLQVARKFHSQRCGFHGFIFMYELHHCLCCILVGDSYGVVFCLKISSNLLIAFILEALMDSSWAVCYGFEMAYTRYMAALNDASWLDIPGILLFSRKKLTMSAMRSAWVLFAKTVWNLYLSISGPMYHPSTPMWVPGCVLARFFMH